MKDNITFFNKSQKNSVENNSRTSKKKLSNEGISSINDKNRVLILIWKGEKINSRLNLNHITQGKLIFQLIILLKLLYKISWQFYFRERILFNSNSITLKVRGSGTHDILCPDYIGQRYFCPSDIYIDNLKVQQLSPCYKIFIDSSDKQIELVWNEYFNSAAGLFSGCENITAINLSNFDFSLVTNMANMFFNCRSLISVDFSNINTKNVISINSMFSGCNSLTSIDLSNFDTSKIEDMSELFNMCCNLKIINLSSFQDVKVLNNINMFKGIRKKPQICIEKNESNSIYNLIRSMSDVEIECENFIISYLEEDCNKEYGCFPLYDSEDFFSHSGCYKCNGIYYFNKIGNFICQNEITICPEDYNKKIQGTNQCTDNCTQISGFQYEFRKECINQCPSGISKQSNLNQFFCELICNKTFPFEIVTEQYCTDFCGINIMGNKTCIINYSDEGTNEDLILSNIKKDIITSNFDRSVLYDKEEKIIIEEGKAKFIITNKNIEKKTGNDLQDLNQCLEILIRYYNLKKSDNLIILIINVQKEDNEKKGYEIYAEIDRSKSLMKLNTNICGDYITNNEIAKCEDYSIDSFIEDLCISCLDPYYPIINDNLSKGSFIKCYKEPKGYFLNSENKYYQKCYSSCDTCNKEGKETNHNCLSCSSNYPNELNINGVLNCYKRCDYYTYYNISSNKTYCTPDYTCPKEFNKLIQGKNKCIEDCKKDTDFPYEFRNVCFNQCPFNISQKSETKNFYCEVICDKENPFEIIKSQTCVNNCTITEREKGLCKVNYISKEEDSKEAEEKAVENIKEELTKDFNTSNIDKGEKIIIKQKGSTVTISTSDSQKNDNTTNETSIDLGECESKIKQEYNIPEDKPLYILKVDVNLQGMKIPKISYEVYYPLFGDNLIKLNLTACTNSKINLSIPVVIKGEIDKVNISSNYYNDICYTYTSEDGTDISLEDRKKEFINKNLTVCEEDCDFIDYDFILEKAICKCKVNINSTAKIAGVVIDKQKLFNSFKNFKNIANYKILKCSKLIFTLEAYKYNYGNIIIIVILLSLIICSIIFWRKDFFALEDIKNKIVYLIINSQKVNKIVNEKKKEEEKSNENKDKMVKEHRPARRKKRRIKN